MKKVGLFGLLALALVVVISITMAGKMGEVSAALARGKVVLDPSVQEAAQGIQTLFVIVSDMESPMPYAAMRVTLSGEYPAGDVYDLILTNERVQKMREMEPWPRNFKLKARLDRDGTAGPDQPGDVVGEVLNVNQGDENVVITLNRVTP